MKPRDRLTLTIEKPAAGGRMIARHDGAVVLVAGAIPGEVVEVEVEKVQRGTAWARTLAVIDASPDRVVANDGACGGNVLAHVEYDRQLILKRQIIEDAFARIAKLAVPEPLAVMGSPAEGYRMRARLHVEHGRIGFFREGTHELCDPATSKQLLPASVDVLHAVEDAFGGAGSVIKEIELSENCPATERTLHLTLRADSDPSRLGSLPRVDGVNGMSCGAEPDVRPLVLWGSAEVADTLAVPGTGQPVVLKRQAHSFFQGNRHLLLPLVGAVLGELGEGPVLDLYAGVGLFSITAAATGREVIAVEGDRVSAQDLKRNAAGVTPHVQVRHQAVEAFLGTGRGPRFETAIVDPPRTGMTREALQRLIAARPARLVYVSCDVATLARDTRLLVDSGYTVRRAQALDLFPNTAHVETIVTFDRSDVQRG